MKKHNFLHRGIGWVERELEATLAILILLAAVVGYTLAGTEAVTPNLTTQDATLNGSLMIGGQPYSTLTFDRTIPNAYQVKKLLITPKDVATVPGKGLVGASATNYTATITLSESFNGPLYVWGKPSGASLNNTPIINENEPVLVTNANSLTLNFQGITNSFRAISVTPPSTNKILATDVANLSLVPATVKTTVGSLRSFIPIATNSNGAAISTDGLAPRWSVVTNPPANVATIDSNGLVTTIGVGTVTVKVAISGKTASATITVVALPPEATTPATSATTNQTTPTTTSANKTATQIAKDAVKQTLLNKIASVIALKTNAATPSTTTSTTVVTPTIAADILFSKGVVAERIVTIGKPTPTTAEVRAITKNMGLVRKITTHLQVGIKQMAFDLKTIAVGSIINDASGTAIYKQPSALKSIFNFVSGLFGGAFGAGATGDQIMRATEGSGEKT